MEKKKLANLAASFTCVDRSQVLSGAQHTRWERNMLSVRTAAFVALTLLAFARPVAAQNSPVNPISLGDATRLSLNNYYDILKTQVGSLGADEFIQLKLVADPVDVSDDEYRYWSHYNLLNRSDMAIEPKPISASVLTSSAQLNRVYGRFLQRLRSFVVRKTLTPEQQLKLADIDVQIDREKNKRDEYEEKEYLKWTRHCEVTGTEFGDRAYYLQWTVYSGYKKELDEIAQKLRNLYFDKKTITDQEYNDPEDREVIDAEYAYEQPEMRLRYPSHPDYMYTDYKKWTLEYLAGLPPASTALFDDRRALTWNVALKNFPTLKAGAFHAKWDSSTGESTSIDKDWKASAQGSYFFISAKASASEQIKINEDFKKAKSLELSAKAAFKTKIMYPGWFRPELFNHKRVKANEREFKEFFGPTGSLLYYPTDLILVRGFSSTFESSQAWTYDYERTFSASAGGGFSVCGIGFGSSASYGSHTEKHKVDKSNTSLTFADGEKTIRFVGYVVKKNAILSTARGPNESLPITEPAENAKALREIP